MFGDGAEKILPTPVVSPNCDTNDALPLRFTPCTLSQCAPLILPAGVQSLLVRVFSLFCRARNVGLPVLQSCTATFRMEMST